MKPYMPLLAALCVAISCNDEVTGLGPPSDPATETFAPSLGVDISQMTRHPLGLYYRDIVIGNGLLVTDTIVSVNVNYAGHLKDGSLFDSGNNALWVLGDLIPGVRFGVLGMREGGRRKLVIPSALGYGGRSRRDPVTGEIIIPRQATLVFDIDVLKVTNPDTNTTPQ